MEIVRKSLALTACASLFLAGCGDSSSGPLPATTPQQAIKHVVVIFDENVSFDHYFGTYPNAANPAGETAFTALPGTPTVNGYTSALLNSNPNSTNATNGAGATNPFRLDPSQAGTADQDHAYLPEQEAADNGAMDLFPASVGSPDSGTEGTGILATTGLTMGYYDGNTVTGLWNLAQNFSMNDNSFGTTYGPSSPGAINVISGQTNGLKVNSNNGNTPNASYQVPDGYSAVGGSYTMVGDSDPTNDICANPTRNQVLMTGKNVGDLLNAAGVTWGAFMGGFDLTATNADGSTGCARTSTSAVTNVLETDYIPHHAWFQYYATTQNANHTRPSSVAAIGTSNDGGANHQYDIHDWFSAVAANNLPAVSFLKAQAYQDGHAGYSDPLDEQAFIASVVNSVEQSEFWDSTAIIIAYDDSDGWYDHVYKAPVNGSATADDMLNGVGICGNGGTTALTGSSTVVQHAQGRCGYGPRLPLLVISPWAKANYVDHTTTDQSSITRFIEDLFCNSTRIQGSFDSVAGVLTNMFDFTSSSPKNTNKPILDPTTGAVGSSIGATGAGR
jgi:phospholipase C